MADGSRIAITIDGFNGYINPTNTYLQAISSGAIHNWERLGLNAADAGTWNDRTTYWHDTLYPKYLDPLQSTSAVKLEVRNFMDDFRTFANPLLDIMAASKNATSDDEVVFNFKIGRAAPSHAITPITETVVYDAKHLGGGEFQFSCRTSHDGAHASLAAGADSVQLVYMIIDNGNNPTPPVPPAGDKPGDKPTPTPNSAGMSKDIITKASFVFKAGEDNVGKSMIVFARWYNTKHPELAGPWSAIKMVVIA